MNSRNGIVLCALRGHKKKMISCHVSGDSQTIVRRRGKAPRSRGKNNMEMIFPSVSISVHQWLKIVFLFFRGFRAFRGSPSSALVARPQAEAHSTRLMASPFDEALDQDHPAKFVSDVKLKEVLTSPWRAYAPRLRSGHRRLSFASATYFQW